MTLADLNQMQPSAAGTELGRCCGSARWTEAMTRARPFSSLDAMRRAADRIWSSLDPSDWLEAFGAHPPIGGESAGSQWSAAEQSGMRTAGEDTRSRLAAMNREYRQRFGYIFIVCASGKSAADMLAMIEERLSHDPDSELVIAAEEQRQITALRLAKLLDAHQ
jgi:2-oxo-4-hydroxy-4-carboxy-5-ureidoimidazoline decarboxylase